jgi:outer membrane protein TolC
MKLLRFLAFLPIAVQAQNIDYNKIILPEKVVPNNFEERLVQLAWKNHPSNQIVLDNVYVAQKEKKLAGMRWLDDIYGNGNLNEYTLKKQTSTDAQGNPVPLNLYYPRYNFGLRFSLGTFFNMPTQSKIAAGKLAAANAAVDQKKLTTREDILLGIEKLKQYYKYVKLRKQIKEDLFSMYKDSEKKFSTGEITIERYRAAVQAYSDQSEQLLEAQTNFNGIKINLEALVGVELTEVEGYSDFIRKLDVELKLD